MSKFNLLVIPFALIIWITTTLMFVQYSRDEYTKLQEKRLEIAVNYCVDAAVDEIVRSTADLGMDYTDYEKIRTDPQVALDMFCLMYCKNYELAATQENFTLIKGDFLPAFIVAAYDGYYIGEPQIINNSGARDLIFSLKQPYLYRSNSNIYALNLGYKDSKCFNGSSIMKVDAPVNEMEQRRVINSAVSDLLMQTIYKQKEGDIHSTVYIPSAMSDIVVTNPIDRITVMAYVTGIEAGYGQVLEVFGIGGARITHAQHVGCYVKDGVKLYTFVEQLPENVKVIDTYENPTIAAQKGYYFDLTSIKNNN